jgi:hypothetical protein
LTRILIFYEYLIFARHATVLLLLGDEEEALLTTLHAVEVVIHVEETDGEAEGTNDNTVHLTSRPRVGEDDEEEHDLDDGHLGHDKTLLDGLDLLGGLWGIHFVTLAVSGHFYYLPRK